MKFFDVKDSIESMTLQEYGKIEQQKNYSVWDKFESDIHNIMIRMYRKDKEYKQNLILGLHSDGDDFLNFLESAPAEILEKYSRISYDW